MNFEKLTSYAKLMRLDKPIGILLLLWPTLFALWLAGQGKPDIFVVCIFIAGVIVMRSAGCVINDLADRYFDKDVKRTQQRPLVTGKVSAKEALCIFFSLCLIAFLLVMQLNFFTIKLSFVALLLAVIYPYMKRYTHLPQVILGAAFGWAIPMAYAALTNQVPLSAFILYFAMLCWTIAYDTQYALVDKMDDLRIGVKSTAILFGSWDKFIIGFLQTITLTILMGLGQAYHFGMCYFVGIIFAAVLILYQQYLIKDRDPENCFKAFLNNNVFGAVLFAGLLLEYHLYSILYS